MAADPAICVPFLYELPGRQVATVEWCERRFGDGESGAPTNPVTERPKRGCRVLWTPSRRLSGWAASPRFLARLRLPARAHLGPAARNAVLSGSRTGMA